MSAKKFELKFQGQGQFNGAMFERERELENRLAKRRHIILLHAVRFFRNIEIYVESVFRTF